MLARETGIRKMQGSSSRTTHLAGDSAHGVARGRVGTVFARKMIGWAGSAAASATGRRLVRFGAPLLVAAVAAVFVLQRFTDISDSLGVLQSLSWWAVGLAVAAELVSNLGFAYLTKSAVRLFGVKLSMGRSAQLALAASSASVVGGGQIAYSGVTVRWLRKEGVMTEAAVLTSILPSILSFLTLTTMAVLGVGFLTASGWLPMAFAPTFAVGLFSLVALVVVAYSMLTRARWLRAIVRFAYGAWQKIRRRPFDSASADQVFDRFSGAGRLLLRRWQAPALGNFVSVGFDMLCVYALFFAVHSALSPELLLVGYGLPALAGQLSIIPGGIGVVEGSMAAVFGSLGVPGRKAIAVVLAYRFLAFWLPLLLGFAFLLALESRSRRASAEPAVVTTASSL